MPTKWDFLISHTGTCNVRFEEVEKQFLACKSRSENERESAFNNEMWYDYHCRRGCTYFTCPYVWYNYHNDPENIIDWEMNIFDGSPKWCHIRTLNIKTVTNWLKYEQNMRAYVKWQGKELGYWSNELTDAELSRAMIMGAEELRLYAIKASTYRHAWIKSDFYDKISDWYFIHRGFGLYEVINEMGEPVPWEEIFDVKELAYTLGAKHLMKGFVTSSDRKDGYAPLNGEFNPEDWNKGRTSEPDSEDSEDEKMSEKSEESDSPKGQCFMAYGMQGLEFEEESGEDTQNNENEAAEQSTEADSQVGEENENTEQSEHSEGEPEAETTMVDNAFRKSQKID